MLNNKQQIIQSINRQVKSNKADYELDEIDEGHYSGMNKRGEVVPTIYSKHYNLGVSHAKEDHKNKTRRKNPYAVGNPDKPSKKYDDYAGGYEETMNRLSRKISEGIDINNREDMEDMRASSHHSASIHHNRASRWDSHTPTIRKAHAYAADAHFDAGQHIENRASGHAPVAAARLISHIINHHMSPDNSEKQNKEHLESIKHIAKYSEG